MKKEKPICCFCGKECNDLYGNNPYPVSKNEEDRCCDFCDTTIVIPKRLEILWAKTKGKEINDNETIKNN